VDGGDLDYGQGLSLEIKLEEEKLYVGRKE
jgi:hypothetical protein